MLISSKIIPLSDTTLLLRSPIPSDADDYASFFRTLVLASPYMVRNPAELDSLERAKSAYLANVQESPCRAILVGYVDGKMIASGEISYVPRQKLRHRASASVGVLPAYWGKGIATAIMQEQESIARLWGIRQIELGCMQGNTRAISLYTKLGYQIFGAIPDGVRMPDGTYQDLVQMRKVLQ